MFGGQATDPNTGPLVILLGLTAFAATGSSHGTAPVENRARGAYHVDNETVGFAQEGFARKFPRAAGDFSGSSRPSPPATAAAKSSSTLGDSLSKRGCPIPLVVMGLAYGRDDSDVSMQAWLSRKTMPFDRRVDTSDRDLRSRPSEELSDRAPLCMAVRARPDGPIKWTAPRASVVGLAAPSFRCLQPEPYFGLASPVNNDSARLSAWRSDSDRRFFE